MKSAKKTNKKERRMNLKKVNLLVGEQEEGNVGQNESSFIVGVYADDGVIAYGCK